MASPQYNKTPLSQGDQSQTPPWLKLKIVANTIAIISRGGGARGEGKYMSMMFAGLRQWQPGSTATMDTGSMDMGGPTEGFHG